MSDDPAACRGTAAPRMPARRAWSSAVRDRRASGGELGALPVVIGLIVIWVVFQSSTSTSCPPRTSSTSPCRSRPPASIALGIVFVLLLGEIDLSVGSVSRRRRGDPGGAQRATTAGAARSRSPLALAWRRCDRRRPGLLLRQARRAAFVVTLAGLLGWQGLQLYLLGAQGTINLPYDGLHRAAHQHLPADVAGSGSSHRARASPSVFADLALVGAAPRGRCRTRRAGPAWHRCVRRGPAGRRRVAAVVVLNADRGVPLALVIFVRLVGVFDLCCGGPVYGRQHLRGRRQRRGGAPGRHQRPPDPDLVSSLLCSMFAAFGGILSACAATAAEPGSGGSDILLIAIAAAVIGGTSLFGGRGSAYVGAAGHPGAPLDHQRHVPAELDSPSGT